jgi:hypothetical protein
VGKTRHVRSTGGQPRRRQGRRGERPARARPVPRRRAGAGRQLLIALLSVGAVFAIIVGLVVTGLTSGTATASEAAAPASVVTQVISLPSSVLSEIGAGQAATSPRPVNSGPPLSIDDKPGIVFVSEESCPFCAAERWAVVIALAHFGTWSHLGATTSSSTDVDPSTATFSFRNATYRSPYLALRTTELANNVGHPLQALTPLDTELIGRYDVPPYVNGVDQSGSVPFLDIDNRYILAGAQYDPQVLAGLSISQIASRLRDPDSPVAKAIDGSADVLIAAISQLLHVTPIRG